MTKPTVLTKSISSFLFVGAISVLQPNLRAQSTISWDGGGVGGTDLGVAANWTGDVLPSVALGDTALWDGTVAGALSLVYSDAAYAGAAGNPGISFSVAGTQTSPLSIDSGVNTNSLRLNNVSIASGAGAFSLGNGANTFNITLGGAGGQTHTWVNNSSNTATIASDVAFGLGGGGAHTFAIDGSGNWAFNNVVGQGTGVMTLTKSGSGTLTLAGANTYSGGTVLNAGSLNVNNAAALGTGALTINGGTLDNTTAGAITLTSTTTPQNWNGDFTFAGTQSLTFGASGTGLTLLGGLGAARQVAVNANTLTIGTMTGFGYGLTKSGAGTLQLTASSNAAVNAITGTLNVTSGKFGIGARDFTAGGLIGSGTVENGSATTRWIFIDNNADNTFSGTLQNGAGAGTLGLSKAGTGTLTLTGTNTYTSQTTLSGGTLEFGSASTPGITQTLSTVASTGLVFDRGDSTVKSSFDGVTGSASLTFGARAIRSAGATGNFVIAGGTNGTTNRINLTRAAGFLDQGFFFGGDNYAVMDGLNTFVRPMVYGTDAGTATSGTTTSLASVAHQEFTGAITDQATATFTTLKDNGNNAFTLTSGATVTTNGILKTGNVAGGATISGGTGIQAASGAELVIRADGKNDSLTINTPILANGASLLTTSGAGTVTLGGNNTFTGSINVAGGTLNLTGTNATTAAINVHGGALNLSNTISAGTTLITVGGSQNGVLNILPGANVSRNNLSVGTFNNGAGAVYQTGGNLTLVQAAGVGNFQLGALTNAYGYYKISGGTLALNEIGVGGSGGLNGIGVMDVTNAGVVNDAGWITVGRGGGTSSGVLNVDGGTMSVGARVNINWAGAAGGQSVVNIKNGSITVANSTTVGLDLANTTAVGTLGEVNLLSGGTITTGIVTASQANPTALLNFNGGTLKATATNAGATFLTNANVDGVFVYSGGGTIDNNGTNITISRPLSAPTGDGVSSIATTGGTNFIGAPMVAISGGGGTGATGVASIDANGNLTGVTITNPGTGYTSTPNVALIGGGGAGAGIGSVSLTTNISGGLTFTGAGTTTLSGANTYTGLTSINSGTVALGASNVFATGGVTINGAAAILSLGANSDSVGTVTLDGGGSITGTGTLSSTSSFEVKSGSAAAPLGGAAAALNKSTAGTVSLSGTSTYTGATNVTGGTLTLTGAGSVNGSSGININGSGAKLVQLSSTAIAPSVLVTNGTLDGTGTVNTVTVGNGTGGVVANGNGTAGTLTVGSLTFNGTATSNVTVNDSSTPGINVTGALTPGAVNPSGIVTVNASNSGGLWSNGLTYDLIQYSTLGGTGFAGFTKGSIAGLGARQSATLTNSAGFIGLSIAGDTPYWTGAQSNAWTTNVISGSKNWRLQTSGTPTDFISGDAVLFDDNATGTTAVNISTGNVNIASMAFDNSSLDYTISSTGGFGITGGLVTKNGTGSVTLNTANSYSGGTTLVDGTLNLNNASALGTGNFTILGGAIGNTSGSPITLAGNTQTWSNNASVNFTGTSNLNLGTGAVTLGSDSSVGAFTLNNPSAASLTVGGAITSAAGGIAGAKALNIGGTGNVALTGNLSLGAGTQLVVNDTNSGTLTLSGAASSITTLNINGGSSSIVDLGAGNLTVSNGGGNIVQSTTGGTINAAGGSIVLGSNNGDFGTAGGTTLTVNANVSGVNGVDFYNANGGTDLGTIVLAGANTYTGATNVENTRVVIPTGGAINAANVANIGQVTVGDLGGIPAVLDLTGGTINATKNTVPSFAVGSVAGALGAVNQSAGTINTTSEFHLGRGQGGYASHTMSGGAINSGNWFVVGLNNDRAVLNQSGGAITVATNRLTIGAGGNGSIGVVNQTGGTFTVNAGANTGVFIGENGTGTYNIAGGNLTLNTNGGATSGTLQFAGNATSLAGNFNLNGGTVTTFGVTKGASTAGGVYRFNFNGGTLQANGNNPAFFSSLANTTAYVNSGGAIIDDGGFAVTVAQPLLAPTGSGVSSVNLTGGSGYIGAPVVQITGDGTGATGVANIDSNGNLTGVTITNPGVNYTNATVSLLGGGGTGTTVNAVNLAANTSGGLTKTGTGTLTLSGANTYTGATTINSGTVALTGSISASTSINVKSGATFDVSGVSGGFAVASGQTLKGGGTVIGATTVGAGAFLSPGASAGTLTTSSLSLDPNSTSVFELKLANFAVGGGINDLVVVNGDLTLDGTLQVAAEGGVLSEGTYTLFDYSGTLTNNGLTIDPAFLAIHPGAFISIDTANTAVLITIPEPGSIASLVGGLGLLVGMSRRRRLKA